MNLYKMVVVNAKALFCGKGKNVCILSTSITQLIHGEQVVYVSSTGCITGTYWRIQYV